MCKPYKVVWRELTPGETNMTRGRSDANDLLQFPTFCSMHIGEKTNIGLQPANFNCFHRVAKSTG